MPFEIPFIPEAASTFARDVDALTYWLVAMGTVATALIAGMMLVFSIRYRRRSEDEVGDNFDTSIVLEVAWTAVPLIVVLFTFAWGTKVYMRLYRPPAGAAEFYVTGKQWMWKMQHPTGQREINELHVPLGQPVKLLMTSEDVLHSFFVPAFRTKMDVIPGRYTTLWFTPSKLGRYHLFCTEYCGVEHSRMIGWVTVMEPEEYQSWLQSGAAPAAPAVAGAQLFDQLACGTCHKDASDPRGPALAGVFGSRVALAAGGAVTADEDYLRESILNPAAKVVAGYQPIMPSFQGQVSEEGLLQLISYIKGLEADRTASAPAVAAEGVAR